VYADLITDGRGGRDAEVRRRSCPGTPALTSGAAPGAVARAVIDESRRPHRTHAARDRAHARTPGGGSREAAAGLL